MKNAMVVILAAAVGTCIWAKRAEPENGPVVKVCMEQVSDSTEIHRAQGEASEIFLDASVRIAWKSGHACEADDAIHIHLSEQTPESLKPGALAYAMPYQETYIIEVFYDRVLRTVGPATFPHVLAHVLVHEITHILQGVARHSESGIMKAHWTPDDCRQMLVHPLPFAPVDVQLLQSSMELRRERLRAQRMTPIAGKSR